MAIFTSRQQAGGNLAAALNANGHARAVVLALPRGGVPVAQPVARSLEAPLELILVRKIGAPNNPEFGIGAVAEGEVEVLDQDSVDAFGLGQHQVEEAISKAREELKVSQEHYRGGQPPPDLAGCTAIIVDDGIATGNTAAAAIDSARARGAAKVIVATPVASPGAVSYLSGKADQLLVLESPQDFRAVGQWYQNFTPVSEEEVIGTISELHQEPEQHPVAVSQGDEEALKADLKIVQGAQGLVIFAHGAGSGRHSRRNQHVAHTLNQRGFSTLLLDLLTEREAQDHRKVFDVELLAGRLNQAAQWSRGLLETGGLPLGLFGASTGAAAAIMAAAGNPDIHAIVSRGGRVDLAGPYLERVHCPTLLLVGSRDPEVIKLNRSAALRLPAHNQLRVIPEASHLFEEPGALDMVADLAAQWFTRYLAPLSLTQQTVH